METIKLMRDTKREYCALLDSLEWAEFSTAVNIQRGHKCEWCDSKEGLAVHHLGYRPDALPWEYRNDEVMLLCAACHSEVHEFADHVWNEVLKCRNKWLIYECFKSVRERIARQVRDDSRAAWPTKDEAWTQRIEEIERAKKGIK